MTMTESDAGRNTVRRITRAAAEHDHRISAFIVGVATSDPFLMQSALIAVDDEAANHDQD